MCLCDVIVVRLESAGLCPNLSSLAVISFMYSCLYIPWKCYLFCCTHILFMNIKCCSSLSAKHWSASVIVLNKVILIIDQFIAEVYATQWCIQYFRITCLWCEFHYVKLGFHFMQTRHLDILTSFSVHFINLYRSFPFFPELNMCIAVCCILFAVISLIPFYAVSTCLFIIYH